MMHDAIVVVLAGWVASAAAGVPVVSRIETVVAPPVPGLRLAPGLGAGDSLDADALGRARDHIADQLAGFGYLSANIEADTVVSGDSVAVRFLIQTGEPARIGGWRVTGDDSVLAHLPRLLPGRGARFTRAVVDRAARSVLSACENSGYPFSVVTPAALAAEGESVYPTLEVAAGPKVDVGFLEFAGRPGTKSGLLARVAGFSPGTYSDATTAHWRQRLQQSGLVEVDSEAIVRAPGTGAALVTSPYGVRFWVTGRRVNSATGVAGYSPTDRRLTGLAQVSFRNLFDTGRKLEAGWQSAYARTSYRLGYTEPWVLGTAIDVAVSARQETVDTTQAKTNLALAASAVAAAWTTVSFETGFDRFTDVPSMTSASVAWAGTGVVVDSRDFPANPRSGVRFSALTKVGNRATDTTHSDIVSHVDLGLTAILPLGRRLAWSNSVGLRAVYSAAALTTAELYTLGGPGTVRGYNEDEFSSTRLGWFNTELRYSLDRISSVYPFLDVGAYHDSDGWHAEPGYGVGTRVATQVGVLGLDYGVAFRRSPLRGKVHLSYDVSF